MKKTSLFKVVVFVATITLAGCNQEKTKETLLPQEQEDTEKVPEQDKQDTLDKVKKQDKKAVEEILEPDTSSVEQESNKKNKQQEKDNTSSKNSNKSQNSVVAKNETKEYDPVETQVLEPQDVNENQENPKKDSASDKAFLDSKVVIDEYGFFEGYSNLSYSLKRDTFVDCGDYYQIEAVFGKPIYLPEQLEEGKTYTVIEDELKNKPLDMVYTKEGLLVGGEDLSYYCVLDEANHRNILYWGSDDRVDAPFYEGMLYIRKDAVTGAAIIVSVEPYKTVTQELLTQEHGFFNGVSFDEKGYVKELIYFGD